MSPEPETVNVTLCHCRLIANGVIAHSATCPIHGYSATSSHPPHESDRLTADLKRVEQERDTLRAQLEQVGALEEREHAVALRMLLVDSLREQLVCTTQELAALRAGLQQVIAEMREMTDLHPYDVFGVHVLLGFRARLEELLEKP